MLQQTSLAGKPTMLFLLFGDQSELRLLPLTTIGHGRLSPITLDADGWHKFDDLYFSPGAEIPVYRHGAALGNAVVRRGMWGSDEPLYKLPGCRALRPLASISLAAAPSDVVTMELIATSDPLPTAGTSAAVVPAILDSAREVAARVAGREGLTATDRASLDLTVAAFHTGASGQPTLVGGYTEKSGGGQAGARHVFMIADSSATGFNATFVHTARDTITDYRRLIDHVDLTGDGVEEIILEGWRPGGDTYLVVMHFEGGHWTEVARGPTSWCADAPKR